jgi:hypothetical protein
MTANLRYWRSIVRDAEAALDAASCLSELKIAASRLMRAREALARLEQAANWVTGNLNGLPERRERQM